VCVCVWGSPWVGVGVRVSVRVSAVLVSAVLKPATIGPYNAARVI
jgi:hypothetical protein